MLKGQPQRDCGALRNTFFREWIRPRIPDSARELVEQHRDRDEVLILTTATKRFLTALTAQDFGIENLSATELEKVDRVFTGRTAGVPNMWEGKVTRLAQWLAERDWPASLLEEATFYSDSINDLPLLSTVANPVAVDQRGWPTIKRRRMP